MKKIKPEQYFYTTDGKVIKSLEELPSALEQMHNGAFYFHVNVVKNDFASWVKHVFNKKALANKIQEAGTRRKTIAVVRKSLVKKPRKTKIEKHDPAEQGYFSELESMILKKRLPKNMLEEMKKAQ